MYILIVFLTSFLTIYFFSRKDNPQLNNRFITIDGLRGFLGISVFIHHAYFWNIYLKTKQWSSSGNYIYNQLGQTSVSLFFMITGFLFLTKIFNTENISWKSFFIQRFYRIAPLYFISILVVIILFSLNIQTNQIGTSSYFSSIFHALTFSFFQNRTQAFPFEMVLINAGVTWSLPYELFFYMSLPMISMLLYRVC